MLSSGLDQQDSRGPKGRIMSEPTEHPALRVIMDQGGDALDLADFLMAVSYVTLVLGSAGVADPTSMPPCVRWIEEGVVAAVMPAGVYVSDLVGHAKANQIIGWCARRDISFFDDQRLDEGEVPPAGSTTGP